MRSRISFCRTFQRVLPSQPGCAAQSRVNEDAKKIIYQEAERYTKRLLSAIAESGLDVRAMPAVFLGGGATLLKHHASAADGLCRPIILDDVCLNAKGYERLTERMSQKHEQ